jgi:hypothetical protein
MKGQDATDRVRKLSAVAIAERAAGPYGSDPHLLTWVDIAEADSFLRAHSSFGVRPLDPAERGGDVADMARIGVEPGVPDPSGSEAKLLFPPPRLLVTETVLVRPPGPYYPRTARRQVRCRVPLRRQ